MIQHTDLQEGRWENLSIEEQMANIGSEVIRAINWKRKGNDKYALQANVRALELFDLTLADTKHKLSLKEIARARELWLDYFLGGNQYKQTANMWEKYFLNLTFAAQNRRGR